MHETQSLPSAALPPTTKPGDAPALPLAGVEAATLTTRDAAVWRQCLPSQRNVFGGLEYAALTERHTGYAARLYVYRQGEALVAYPFFLRPTADLPFAAPGLAPGWDSLSPEYTGPLAAGPIDPTTAANFRQTFADYCRRERLITEFAHLHPWQTAADLLEPEGVTNNREIVYVDLTWPAERLLAESFTYACRKNIKRAQQAGIEVVAAKSPAEMAEFYRIYTQTMDRNQAQARYYFPHAYFTAIFETMPDNARFALALHAGQVVAATLYLHDEANVYSYLGGADHAFQNLRPTNAVIYETIRWAQQQGKQRLILGGGYQPQDNIFRFKTSFSPLTANFQVYKQVHLPEANAALTQAWSAHYQRPTPPEGYFPVYRMPPPP